MLALTVRLRRKRMSDRIANRSPTGGRQHRYERWPAGSTDNLCTHKVPAEERLSSLIQRSPRATAHTKDQYDKTMEGRLR